MEVPAVVTQRILVVDDESFVRDVTARLVVALGLPRPVEAKNGREALDILEAQKPPIDLIVCDLMMPDMDGVELVRHISEHEVRPAILFLSGAQSSLLRAAVSLARAYGLKVVGALSKPIQKEAFAK